MLFIFGFFFFLVRGGAYSIFSLLAYSSVCLDKWWNQVVGQQKDDQDLQVTAVKTMDPVEQTVLRTYIAARVPHIVIRIFRPHYQKRSFMGQRHSIVLPRLHACLVELLYTAGGGVGEVLWYDEAQGGQAWADSEKKKKWYLSLRSRVVCFFLDLLSLGQVVCGHGTFQTAICSGIRRSRS
jgi:hypothetical protein